MVNYVSMKELIRLTCRTDIDNIFGINNNSTVNLICNVAKHGIIDGNFHEISRQWRYPESHLRSKLQFRSQIQKSVIDINRA